MKTNWTNLLQYVEGGFDIDLFDLTPIDNWFIMMTKYETFKMVKVKEWVYAVVMLFCYFQLKDCFVMYLTEDLDVCTVHSNWQFLRIYYILCLLVKGIYTR